MVKKTFDPVDREFSKFKQFWRLVIEQLVTTPNDIAFFVNDIA